MKYSSNKDVNQMVSSMVQDGWRFINGKKHNRLICPRNGKTLFFAKSPSDYRAIHKMKRDIKHLENQSEDLKPTHH